MKRIVRIFACAAAFLLLAGCASGEKKKAEAELYAMDTVMDLTIYATNAEEALSAAQEEIYRLDGLLSYTRSDSQVSAINRGAGGAVEVPVEVMDLVSTAVAISQRTDGAFDITVAPLVQAWGFYTGEYTVPDKEALDEILPLVGSGLIRLDPGAKTVELEKTGMSIDLGGIAKGYASDVLVEMMKDRGVSSALLALAGNISAVGTKPGGDLWRVAVRDPRDGSAYVGILSVSNLTVATSGGYERYFESGGKRYHHIIDPKTGVPADSDLTSVTVISQSGTTADALSTGLFVMGMDKALALWRASKDFEAVFVTQDDRVVVTEGIADRFEFTGQSGGYAYEIASR